MYHPMWEPFAGVNEVRCRCTSTRSSCRAGARQLTLTRRAAVTGSRLPDEPDNILAAIIGAAVLERYPHLGLVRRERHRWILTRRPHGLRVGGRFRSRLTMKPSDYAAPVQGTFQFDRIGTG